MGWAWAERGLNMGCLEWHTPMPDYRVFCARQSVAYLRGGGRGTLWRVLPWMNGRRPDPLDALSLHNGVIFSRRRPNSLELFHLIKRLPSKTRAPLAKMSSFIHIIYHITFPKQTSSSLPSWKGYEKEQKTPRRYTMPFQLIIIGIAKKSFLTVGTLSFLHLLSDLLAKATKRCAITISCVTIRNIWPKDTPMLYDVISTDHHRRHYAPSAIPLPNAPGTLQKW